VVFARHVLNVRIYVRIGSPQISAQSKEMHERNFEILPVCFWRLFLRLQSFKEVVYRVVEEDIVNVVRLYGYNDLHT
jgi:hypothetical protein